MKDSLCCCVCLKDEPFDNNPIVSCDGKNCTTVVHKACYGIQHIPEGAWFCQKCISQERTARVRCELCPSRDGALKHTNKGGWCHIVCALFVPGAEFLDVDRLETVSLDKVTSDRLNKVCSICEKNNRLDRASIGACIQCIKSGCKVLFHVTCGQSLGLLTEVVSVKEGVRYVAYCCLHKQKSKRRDFTIRLSNSINCPSRHDKNKLRQSPPQLEKSDEDCTTPQESSSSFICRSISSRNPNISSSSSNINISSDSMSQDDCSAPEICTRSEFSGNKESIGAKDSNILSKYHSTKIIAKLEPPNIITEILSNDNLLPPNICYSESIPKLEATVKLNRFQASSAAKNKLTGLEISTVRSSKRQGAILISDIPQKREKIIKTEQKSQSKEFPIKIEKVKKTKKLSNVIKAKIEDRVGKQSVAPSVPRSLFSHMNTVTTGGGASTSSSSSSIPNTAKTQGGTSCQSMEELLEWQWDQSGTLLMQQAEASDIASLLSCLHDLKNENEQLLSKQLKLSHRRDHLNAINAKLQLQLMSKSNDNITKASSLVPNPASIIDFRSNVPQTSIRPILKTPSLEQQQPHIQYKQMVNSDIIRPRIMTEGSSVIIQQQQQPIWSQSSSHQHQQQQQQQHQQQQQRVDQSLNQQTLALLKHYQQQQQQQQPMEISSSQITQSMPAGVSVSNLFSQTDLVALLNNQLHSQLSSSSQSTLTTNQMKPINQDVHISPNNGTNMEFLYQTLQQKNQVQQKYQTQSNIYYQTSSKLPMQSGSGMNFDSSQNQDKSAK